MGRKFSITAEWRWSEKRGPLGKGGHDFSSAARSISAICCRRSAELQALL